MLENYTEEARRTLFLARYEASRLGSRLIDTEHLLLGILRQGDEVVSEILRRFYVKPEEIRREIGVDRTVVVRIHSTTDLPMSDEARRALTHATQEAEGLRHRGVACAHLLLGLLRLQESQASRVLVRFGFDAHTVRKEVAELTRRRPEGAENSEMPLVAEFGRDFTALALEGGFDPLIGRRKELVRLIQILCRRTKNNPILLGEPGIGKTAIVEGLAQRIVEGRVPAPLRNRRIVALDLSLLVAGTKYRGQFEERLKGVLKELREHREVVVFFDEIHSLVGAGSAEGSLDAANILKPALSRGEISCIGATTQAEYRRYIEKDRALQRRFQPIQVDPPTPEQALEVLEGVKERYEAFHQVRYSPSALRAAVYQTDRYINERHLPDKALDVLDEAGARVKLGALLLDLDLDAEPPSELNAGLGLEGAAEDGYPAVSQRDVEAVIAVATGIPVTQLHSDEAEKLLGMEEILQHRVVGQNRAISAISRAIRRSRLGVASPQRPMGSFIFLGPSGVGKTEVARRLAEFLFGSERSLLRFDMSEYMEPHSVSKLIGSPPGYVGHEDGGQLTERIRRQPYSLILFDEIEKAHGDVANILLQILEDGHLSDSLGNRVDFRNTLVLLTSNIGSRMVLNESRMGFGETDDEQAFQRVENEILRELKRYFSPEFINRLDEVIVFNPLRREDLSSILYLQLEDVNATLADRGLRVEITPEAGEWLLDKAGIDPSTGARPLRRTLQRHIQDPISEILVQRHGESIAWIEAHAVAGELDFRVHLAGNEGHLEESPEESASLVS